MIELQDNVGQWTCILVKSVDSIELHLHLCAFCGRIKNTLANINNFYCEGKVG